MIRIYTTSDCVYCNRLKKILTLLRVSFIEMNIDSYKDDYEKIVEKIHHYYVPVIEINDEIISPTQDFNTISEAANIIFNKLKK